jgi:hypothetical protein
MQKSNIFLTAFFFFEQVFPSAMVKGKAIPSQAWTGPEGSRRLGLLDFKIVGT